MTARAVEAPVRKHPDELMTKAQIARRKFKSSLPRGAQLPEVTLTPMHALGELFRLMNQFLIMIRAEQPKIDATKTLYAALVYTLPGAKELASRVAVPDPGEKVGAFCDTVMGLRNAKFLGVVFIQTDPEAAKAEYQSVSFVVPFETSHDAAARLLYAQQEELTKYRKMNEYVSRLRKG